MGYWAQSFAMFRVSLRVLRENPRLALFPVFSGLAVLLVAAAFLTPAFFVLVDRITA